MDKQIVLQETEKAMSDIALYMIEQAKKALKEKNFVRAMIFKSILDSIIKFTEDMKNEQRKT